MGRAELEQLGDQAITAIRAESGYSEHDWEASYMLLDRNYGPTAYLFLFLCRHCGVLGGYSDSH